MTDLYPTLVGLAHAGIPRTPTDEASAWRTQKQWRVDLGLDLDGVDLSGLILRAFQLLPTTTKGADSSGVRIDKTSGGFGGSGALGAPDPMRGVAWVSDQDDATDRIVFAGSK